MKMAGAMLTRAHALAVLLSLSTALSPASAQTSRVVFTATKSTDSGGTDPAGRVVGDFNQDGRLDLLVTSKGATSSNVNLFTGDGSGSLSFARGFMFFPADAAAAADFNGDGFLDVVLTQDVPGKVGYGDVICGASVGIGIFFGPAMSAARCVASVPRGVAVQAGDFDGDGRPDIAVVSASGHGLVIYSELDFVTHAVKTTTVAGGSVPATGMARPVDLNGDGTLDLVVSHSSGVKTFLGNGDGTFRTGGSAGGTNHTRAAAVGDLNGDVIPDIASVESTVGRLLVGFGLGDGTFSTAVVSAIGADLPDIAVADVDHDGHVDIVVAHRDGGAIRMFFGEGNGTFVTNPPLAISVKPKFLAMHDWDEDGDVDLAVLDTGVNGESALAWMALQDGLGPPDVTPPNAELTSPGAGSIVRGTVAVTASAADDVGVTHVDFYAGATLIGKSAGPSYTVSWDTGALPSGPVTLRASAFDAALNESTRTTIQVTVAGDPASVNVNKTNVAAGTTVSVTVADGPGNTRDWVALYRVGHSAEIEWKFLNGAKTASAAALTSATLSFTLPTAPGTYALRFYANNSYDLLATSATITVVAATLTPSAPMVTPGTNLTATIADGPGNPTDWVALFAVGASSELDWRFLNGSHRPPVVGVTTAAVPISMPTKAGTYVLKLFANNTYTLLATSTIITVLPPPAISFTVNTREVSSGAVVTATIANGPGNVKDWVGLYPVGGTVEVDWQFLDGSKTAPAAGLANAMLSFTMPTTPGAYTLRLHSNNTYNVLAIITPITVSSPSAALTFTVSETVAVPGTAVTAIIAHGPGNATDWVGLYVVGHSAELDWKFLSGARSAPAAGLSDATVAFVLPLTSGAYILRFYSNNTYNVLASGTVTVQ